MSSNQPNPKAIAENTAEPKARGANRSTKVAGKLKVLPDQVEPVLRNKVVEVKPPPKDKVDEEEEEEAESDEDEGDDEEEPEEIEVCRAASAVTNVNIIWTLHSVGIQPDRLDPCGYCTERCSSTYQEEGEVVTTRYRVCHS